MGKTARLHIKETSEELKTLARKQKKPKNIDRIRSLQLIQSNKFNTRQELADYLGYHIRTMERWLSKYKKGGMDQMLIPEVLERKSHIVTPAIHQALHDRLHKEKEGFKSYVEAQQWVEETFDVKMTYHWIRAYMIQHFKTKVKRPRKSHVKKDSTATQAFLKTT